MMTIGQNIRVFRMQRGLSQVQLAQMIGMTGPTIGNYEKGLSIPKRRVVERIACALDVPAEKIMEEAPAVPSEDRKETGDRLLYDGVLTAMKELYGMVEGRVIVGKNGQRKKYYIVRHPAGSFVLYEKDISAIVRSAKASMPPLAEHMRKMHGAASGGAG